MPLIGRYAVLIDNQHADPFGYRSFNEISRANLIGLQCAEVN
jgi:hypothetical protein